MRDCLVGRELFEFTMGEMVSLEERIFVDKKEH